MTLSSVLLPAPLGPTTASSEPASMARLTSSSAGGRHSRRYARQPDVGVGAQVARLIVVHVVSGGRFAHRSPPTILSVSQRIISHVASGRYQSGRRHRGRSPPSRPVSAAISRTSWSGNWTSARISLTSLLLIALISAAIGRRSDPARARAHDADNVDAVFARVVGERVVEGDQLALLRRDRRELRPYVAVERGKLSIVGGGVGVVVGLVGRIDFVELEPDAIDVGARVERSIHRCGLSPPSSLAMYCTSASPSPSFRIGTLPWPVSCMKGTSQSSRPRPFITTSLALLSAAALLGVGSNVCTSPPFGTSD